MTASGTTDDVVVALRLAFQGDVVGPETKDTRGAVRLERDDRQAPAAIACCREGGRRRRLAVARERGCRWRARRRHDVAGTATTEAASSSTCPDARRRGRRGGAVATSRAGDLAGGRRRNPALRSRVAGRPGLGTGVGGLTLGGGIGWLRRSTASAATTSSPPSSSPPTAAVRAAVDENPDLFWGFRGGGGNFGVVTAFQFRLTPSGQVAYTLVLYNGAQTREACAPSGGNRSHAPQDLAGRLHRCGSRGHRGRPAERGQPKVAWPPPMWVETDRVSASLPRSRSRDADRRP